MSVLIFLIIIKIHIATNNIASKEWILSRIITYSAFIEAVVIHNTGNPTSFINHSFNDVKRQYFNRLYAVPKKKPSLRRTRIRKTAWMKRFPKHYKRPMMLDMYDIVKYTEGTLTKARTTYQNWLNLPNTTLEDGHPLTKVVRKSW